MTEVIFVFVVEEIASKNIHTWRGGEVERRTGELKQSKAYKDVTIVQIKNHDN